LPLAVVGVAAYGFWRRGDTDPVPCAAADVDPTDDDADADDDDGGRPPAAPELVEPPSLGLLRSSASAGSHVRCDKTKKNEEERRGGDGEAAYLWWLAQGRPHLLPTSATN
jgi:hypothetical protein